MTYFPHLVCLRGNAALIWNSAATDVLIALAYYAIPAVIFLLRRRGRMTLDPSMDSTLAALQIFIVSCGTGHAVDALNIWFPQYWLKVMINYVTVASSLCAALIIVRHGRDIGRLMSVRRDIGESLRGIHREFIESQSQLKGA